MKQADFTNSLVSSHVSIINNFSCRHLINVINMLCIMGFGKWLVLLVYIIFWFIVLLCLAAVARCLAESQAITVCATGAPPSYSLICWGDGNSPSSWSLQESNLNANGSICSEEHTDEIHLRTKCLRVRCLLWAWHLASLRSRGRATKIWVLAQTSCVIHTLCLPIFPYWPWKKMSSDFFPWLLNTKSEGDKSHPYIMRRDIQGLPDFAGFASYSYS